ncbi:hypothetical protein HDK77DRAFT_426973 [Phyllosticta capitalensis]
MLFSRPIPFITLTLAATSIAAPAATPQTTDIAELASFVPVDYANLTAEHLDRRGAPLGVYFCKGPFWNGPCAFHPERFGLCNNMPAGWNNQVSSWGPPRRYYCDLFEHWNCQGRKISLTYPGSGNLARNGFNNIGSSWRCSAANAKGVLLGWKRDAEAEAGAEAEPEWETDVVGAPAEAEESTM